MLESRLHLDAFECYFVCKQSGCSVSEAVRLVKGEYKVSKKTVYKWKKVFDWDGRETIRSAIVQQKVEEQTNTTLAENKIRYLRVYHQLLKDLERDFNIKINNVNDLDNVIRGALFLQGADRVKQHVSGLDRLSESLRKSFKELADK